MTQDINTFDRPEDIAIKIDSLTYSYRDEWTRKVITAVENICLDVRVGESFGFLGHNGSGKTTTMKSILNIIKPIKGSILITGVSSNLTESRRNIGYLPEQPYFYDHLTVYEALDMYASLVGVPKKNKRDRLFDLLKKLKIDDRADKYLKSLSKGLTQRFALAQALVGDPNILLLDEPFSGLDPLGRIDFRDIFLDLKKQGKTLFISSHILSDVEIMCDRVSILVKGKLKGIYDLKELRKMTRHEYELVLPEDAAHILMHKLKDNASDCINRGALSALIFKDDIKAREALSLALELNLIIESFQHLSPKLEDIFIEAVKTN